MSEEKCGNCRFWKEYGTDSYEGRCRRYPPLSHQYEFEDGAAQVYHSKFPESVADEWCGEYQPTLVDPRTPNA